MDASTPQEANEPLIVDLSSEPLTPSCELERIDDTAASESFAQRVLERLKAIALHQPPSGG